MTNHSPEAEVLSPLRGFRNFTATIENGIELVNNRVKQPRPAVGFHSMNHVGFVAFGAMDEKN